MNRRRLMKSNSNNGRFMIGDYEVVDLGLPSGLLWATYNVGATKETDYGNRYKYGYGAQKWNGTDAYYRGQENTLKSSADTATQVMGGGWRMPTKSEFQELINNTDYEWVTNFNGSGKNGGKFTSKTNPNAYVFFPAAGWGDEEGYVNGTGSKFYVWSSTRYSNDIAYHMYNSNWTPRIDGGSRCYGFSVRGVHAAI